MKEIPEIVKQLREEEKLGSLKSLSLNTLEINEEMEPINEKSSDMIHVFKEDKELENGKNEIGSIEEKYKTIFENYAVAITIADENEQIISWNKYAEELFNMNGEELAMKHVSTLYPPGEWQKIRAENIRQKGMKHKLDTKMIRKGSEPFNVEVSLSVLKGARGKITGSVAIIKDITEYKRTEKKLVESKAKYKTIFENSAVAIMLTDEKERIISWNKYTETLLGFDKKDLYMKPVESFYPPEEWQKIRAENIRQKGMKHSIETKMLSKNNEPLDVDISLSVLKNHEGTIIGSIGVIKNISERKEIERKLNYEHDLLQSLLDNVPDSIVFKDKESKFIKVNNAKAIHYDTTSEKMISKTDFDFLPEDEAKRIHEDDGKVIKTGEPIINKLERLTDKNGGDRWISVTKIPRYNDHGKIIGTMSISHDVTDIKKTDEKLRKSEKKYKKLFESAIDPIIVLDTDGVFVDVNKQVTKLLGYAKSDLIGKKFNEVNIFSKDSIDIISENFKKRICGEDIGSYEIKAITKDDDIIPVKINASLLHEGKKVVGYLIILRDLSDRLVKENVEKDLIESEKKFREIFDSTSDFLLYLETGVILDINNTALELSGIKKDEIIGRSFSNIKDVFSQEDMTKHLEAVSNACQGVKVNDYECDLITRYGKKYKFLFSTDCIREKEKIKGILIRGKDITQRQQAWDELVRLEEKYRVLAETSADGVLTIDSLGRLTYVNPSFEKMCGRRKSQILATLFRDYLSDDSIYLFQQVFIDARKKDEKVENVELELTNTDKGTIPIEANIAPLKTDEGKFVGMICTVRDITGRKEVEDELKKSERLKTEFMNIAAHELKSPVTPIKGYLDLIISDEDASEKIKNWAKVSLRNSERLLRLVNDILDVSRLDSDTMKFDMSVLNSVEILDEIVEDMKPAVEKKSLDFIAEIPRDLPNIMGDRYRLSQVLKNLFVNAVKFTDHGSISITAKKEKKYILITVEDTGIGISKSEVKKVFSKFYQAYTGDDRKNEGTGLGLFICKEIVQKHNGKIWAESVIGKGSTFSIKLPYL